jgi:hypothetical protein
MGNHSIRNTLIAAAAATAGILGLIFTTATLVTYAEERQLYRTGTVIDVRVMSEQRYSRRTMRDTFETNGSTQLFDGGEGGEAAGARRARYRYQLSGYQVTFTLRNRPGTQRLPIGLTIPVVYDAEDVTNFRLYRGYPQVNRAWLLTGIGFLALGVSSAVLVIWLKMR